MYLNEISIENIRSIKRLNIEFDDRSYPGWHVFLGDNGAGKTTVIRSIALGLMGPVEAAALRQNWNDWLPNGEASGRITLQIAQDSKLDKATAKGRQVQNVYINASLFLTRLKSASGTVVSMAAAKNTRAKRYLWGDGNGWFSASYGPFRRFTGGDSSLSKLFYSNRRLAPHLSAFGEDVALTECLGWLQSLHVKKLEDSKPDALLLENLTKFLNGGGLLPHGTRLHEVSSEGVMFQDGNANHVAVNLLSDGYRSILSMTFELIRQMTLVYGAETVFEQIREGEMVINLPGVVLIDEIDAHLHPTWQRRIGYWFSKYFPRVQFIVTTHSPLVCHAAERGSVWKLPNPGSGEVVKRVEGATFRSCSTAIWSKPTTPNCSGFHQHGRSLRNRNSRGSPSSTCSFDVASYPPARRKN